MPGSEAKQPFVLAPERRAWILHLLREEIVFLAKKRKAEIKQLAVMGALCLHDAFQGRLNNGSAAATTKGKFIENVFFVQTHKIFFRIIIGACFLHSIALFYEPENACSNIFLYKCFQWLVLVIYATDVAMKISYEGFWEYISIKSGHTWQLLYMLSIGALILDTFICGCTTYANFLRPFVGVLRARNSRRFGEALQKMIPALSHSLVPIFFFIIIITAMCALMFDSHIKELSDPAYTSYNWLFLIFTNDNFNRILPSSMSENISYLSFFFPTIYVGQKFLLSLIIGDTYETFGSFMKKNAKNEQLRHKQGLVKAFSVMDDRKKGVIGTEEWKALMQAYKPGMCIEAIALYYELLSGGSDHGITVLQFLSLGDVLSFNFKLVVPSKSTLGIYKQKAQETAARAIESVLCVDRPIPSAAETLAAKALAFLEKYELVSYVNTADLFCLVFGVYNWTIPVAPIASLSISPCFVLGSLYVVECAIRVVAAKGNMKDLFDSLSLVNVLFVLGTVVAFMYPLFLLTGVFSEDSELRCSIGGEVLDKIFALTPSSSMGGSISSSSSGEEGEYVAADVLNTVATTIVAPFAFHLTSAKVLLIARAFRCLRMISLNEALDDFFSALTDILPTVVETFVFTLIVSYMFGLVGHILLGAYMDEWATPTLAVIKSVNLMFMVGFLDSIEAAMEAVHPSTIIFFFVYLIMGLTVSNIALSIVIDLHATVMDVKSQKDEKAKDKMTIVLDKCITQARLRMAFHSVHDFPQFNRIRPAAQSANTTEFLSGGSKGGGASLEDIKACSKYSNIDLVQHYNETHRHVKDLNWEVDFVKAIHDTGEFQEQKLEKNQTLFKKGDSADKLYLIVAGSVVLSREKDEKTLILPTNFIGSECMEVKGLYETTCVGETEGKYFCFTPDDIANKLDEEVCGSLARIMFKSHEAALAGFAEAKKRMASRRQSMAAHSFRQRGDATGGKKSLADMLEEARRLAETGEKREESDADGGATGVEGGGGGGKVTLSTVSEDHILDETYKPDDERTLPVVVAAPTIAAQPSPGGPPTRGGMGIFRTSSFKRANSFRENTGGVPFTQSMDPNDFRPAENSNSFSSDSGNEEGWNSQNMELAVSAGCRSLDGVGFGSSGEDDNIRAVSPELDCTPIRGAAESPRNKAFSARPGLPPIDTHKPANKRAFSTKNSTTSALFGTASTGSLSSGNKVNQDNSEMQKEAVEEEGKASSDEEDYAGEEVEKFSVDDITIDTTPDFRLKKDTVVGAASAAGEGDCYNDNNDDEAADKYPLDDETIGFSQSTSTDTGGQRMHPEATSSTPFTSTKGLTPRAGVCIGNTDNASEKINTNFAAVQTSSRDDQGLSPECYSSTPFHSTKGLKPRRDEEDSVEGEK